MMPQVNESPSHYLFVDEFDGKIMGKYVDDFFRLELDPAIQVIVIYISSPGGDTCVMNAMRDLIKTASKPVCTVALGQACSAGALLLAAGTKGYRFAAENTEIMVHEVSSGIADKTKDIVNYAHSVDRFNKMVKKNFAIDCGIEYEELEEHIKSISNSDWFMTVKEAKQWGIVDHIGLPRTGFVPLANTLLMPEAKKKKKKRSIKPATP